MIEHRFWISRTRYIAWALGLVLLLPMGCSEESDSETTAMLDAWKQAGLTPTMFMPVEVEALRPGACRQGKVDGIEATLCRYQDAGAARTAQPAGLAHVGATTGLAITAGHRLLIVADRDGADPTGRTINRIATAFREHDKAAPAGQARPDGKGDTGGEPADAPKNRKGS